jgi:ABC-type sugar transport system ATPase subunit
MQSGRFRQVGAPMEIYAKPATRFIGGFVGSPRMNLFPGRLTRRSGGATDLECLGTAIRLEGSGAVAKVADAADVTVGIRPEDISIVGHSEADLVARADVIEPLGREVLLHFVPDPGPDGALLEIRVMAGAAGAVEAGTMAGLKLRRDRIHLFDAASEERLTP